MSYEGLPAISLGDLRHELPRRGREIYQAAYNRAYETLMASGGDHDAQSIAETAHKARGRDKISEGRARPLAANTNKRGHGGYAMRQRCNRQAVNAH
jgi:cation transport regulator ChaB